MEDDKHVAPDGDSDLSFESLTFGDSHNDHHMDRNGQQGPKKKDKFRKKFNNKKEPPHTPEGEKSSSVYITTQDDKLDVQALLRRLEHYGAVRGYYFKEKQNFGIVQFVDPSIVDAVIESFSTNDTGFRVTVERTSRTKDFHASPHSFGSIPPSLSSTPIMSVTSPTFSTPPPPEKPDTILVLKNLPFTLKQDQLHEILLSLSTTIPQSISLHYDNGVFKGMAFIKYRQLEDAIQVYELLNGMDVGGRKVRVEYKRKPAAKAQADVPAEWQEDEELRKLWEQLKEFKEDANQTEWYYPPTLTNNQKRNIYNMTERLKLVQGTAADGEVRVLFLRKGHNVPVSPNAEHGHNGHSGSVDAKNRGIEIKGRRTRHDSDAASRSGAASPNDRERVGRNSVGRNEGHKHSIASSAPADMNLDWRSNQSSHSTGSSYNNSYNHAQFAHNMQIHHQQQQQQQQQTPILAPVRQPKGPDGSKGFDAPRKAGTCAFLVSTEVSAS